MEGKEGSIRQRVGGWREGGEGARKAHPSGRALSTQNDIIKKGNFSFGHQPPEIVHTGEIDPVKPLSSVKKAIL